MEFAPFGGGPEFPRSDLPESPRQYTGRDDRPLRMLVKWFPDVPVRWRDVWLGALTSAVLFRSRQARYRLVHRQPRTSVHLRSSRFSGGAVDLGLLHRADCAFGAEISHAYARRNTRGIPHTPDAATRMNL